MGATAIWKPWNWYLGVDSSMSIRIGIGFKGSHDLFVIMELFWMEQWKIIVNKSNYYKIYTSLFW